MSASRRIIHVAHSSIGRVRLRLSWLRDTPREATLLADHLAALDGMIEAALRPWTGSVLCHFDPDRLDESRIINAVRRCTRVTLVVHRGEEIPASAIAPASSDGAPASSLARAVAESFASINRQVLAATDGQLDLGILTSLGFMTAGAAEVLVMRQLPAPPWFNLAWWAVRTFTTFERDTGGITKGTSSPSISRPSDKVAQRTRPQRRSTRRHRPRARQRRGPSVGS